MYANSSSVYTQMKTSTNVTTASMGERFVLRP
jgi:hypothetical protein